MPSSARTSSNNIFDLLERHCWNSWTRFPHD